MICKTLAISLLTIAVMTFVKLLFNQKIIAVNQKEKAAWTYNPNSFVVDHTEQIFLYSTGAIPTCRLKAAEKWETVENPHK